MSDMINKLSTQPSRNQTGSATAKPHRSHRLAIAAAVCVVGMWTASAANRASADVAPAAVPATAPVIKAAPSDVLPKTPATVINDSAAGVVVPVIAMQAAPAAPAAPATGPSAAAAPVTAAPAAPVAASQINLAQVPPITMQGVNDADASRLTIENPVSRTRLDVLVNKSIVLQTKAPYTRVAVAQPDIADVNLLTPNHVGGQHQPSYNILLTGKKPGTTQVIVWDADERAEVYDVTVKIDVAGLKEQLARLFPGLTLDVSSINGNVGIQGHVPSLAVADQVLQVAKPYTPAVLDLMEISGGQQVVLQVRFAEVSRSCDSELGVNFGFSDGKSYFGQNLGGSAFTLTPNAGGVNSIMSNVPSPAVSVFGNAAFGEEALDYFVDALRANNLMRTLAEPNVMAISGQEASFLAGGEIPIPVAQPGGGGAVSITYQEYGVKLKFVPVVLGNGRIRLKVSPEVSDLDYANAISAGGFRIPALTQRSLSTVVELADGQTFAVGGLLDNEVAANSSITPVLGDLPILGPLFRSVRYSRTETELVVLVTPHLVEPLNPGQIPHLPGEIWRTPSEGELFWNADLGGTAPADANHRPLMADASSKNLPKSAPLFHGQFGFVAVSNTTEAEVASIHD